MMAVRSNVGVTDYSSIQFAFETLKQELDAMLSIATPFLARNVNNQEIFRSLAQQLDLIRDGGRRGSWKAVDWQVIRTRDTRAYEPGGGGGISVIGEVSWTWDLAPDKARGKWACLCGIASIRSRVLSASDPNSELAMWRTEVGDAASPGCFFHQQILGQSDTPPFPKVLSIPRLPALLVTPMAAFEFLLGELFQDEWQRCASRETGKTQFWRATQKEQVLKLLEWKRARIEECSSSPWLSLKAAKPRVQDCLFGSGGK